MDGQIDPLTLGAITQGGIKNLDNGLLFHHNQPIFSLAIDHLFPAGIGKQSSRFDNRQHVTG
jgi:hypothetical protein